MLEVTHLTVGYGTKPVLKDVSFRLADGEILAVIGPNGAGKSTLVRAISGILLPERGKICYNGQDLHVMSVQQRARMIAVVPQARNLPTSFTGWQVVSLGRTPYLNWFGQLSTADEILVREAMRRTETDHLAHRLVGELSGGETQRLLLARALVQATPVMVLDEPTTHLDLQYQIGLLNRVVEVVRQPMKKNGNDQVHAPAALVVLHDLNLVARYADRVLLLVEGVVRAFGSKSEVLRPALLSEAFGIPLEVIRSPNGKYPLVVPLMA